MPKKIDDIEAYLKHISSISTRVLACLENQSLWVGDMKGNDRMKVFGLQKLFENFTNIKMLLEQLKFDYILVSSVTWQSSLGLINRKKKETLTEKKNRHKEFAQSKFKIKVTHHNEDALLILYFLLYKNTIDKNWFEGRIIKTQFNIIS